MGALPQQLGPRRAGHGRGGRRARLLGNAVRGGRNHAGWRRGGGWTGPGALRAAERAGARARGAPRVPPRGQGARVSGIPPPVLTLGAARGSSGAPWGSPCAPSALGPGVRQQPLGLRRKRGTDDLGFAETLMNVGPLHSASRCPSPAGQQWGGYSCRVFVPGSGPHPLLVHPRAAAQRRLRDSGSCRRFCLPCWSCLPFRCPCR